MTNLPDKLTESSTSVAIPPIIGLARLGEDLLDDDEDPQCALYGTPAFVEWIASELPLVAGNADSEWSPVDEVEFLFAELLRGRTHCWFQRLMPQKKGVWEARLDNTRIFGWFVAKRHLILSRGVDIVVIKAPGDPTYRHFINEVVDERKSLKFDYLAGDIRNVF